MATPSKPLLAATTARAATPPGRLTQPAVRGDHHGPRRPLSTTYRSLLQAKMLRGARRPGHLATVPHYPFSPPFGPSSPLNPRQPSPLRPLPSPPAAHNSPSPAPRRSAAPNRRRPQAVAPEPQPRREWHETSDGSQSFSGAHNPCLAGHLRHPDGLEPSHTDILIPSHVDILIPSHVDILIPSHPVGLSPSCVDGLELSHADRLKPPCAQRFRGTRRMLPAEAAWQLE